MPYEITRSGCPEGKPYAVRKQGGAVIGCHASEASAQRQMAALYANEKSHVKTAIKREQGIDFPPRDYAFVPDPLRPATWRLRLTETPGKVSEMMLRRAAAALSPKGFRGNRVEIPGAALTSVKRRLRAEFRRLGVEENRIPSVVKAREEEEFFVWKDAATGLQRWFAIYSNNFRDDDHPSEIIAEQSHLNFVDLVDEGIVDFPELWLWHTKGTAWGKADWLSYVSGFAMASGLVYPGYERIAKNLMQRGNLRVSHGMPKSLVVYDTKDSSVILFHVTTEISPLPDYAAANRLTGFTILDEGETLMGNATKMPADKRAFLKEAGLADSLIDTLEANLSKAQSLATEAGIESKEADSLELTVEIEETTEEEEEVVELDSDDPDAELGEGDVDADEEEAGEPEAQEAVPAQKQASQPKQQPAKKPAKKKMPAATSDKAANPAPDYVTKQEVAEAVSAVINPLLETIGKQNAAIEALTKEIADLQAEDAEKIARTKEVTPSSSLADLIRGNIIGKEAARVDGRTTMSKEGPVETAPQVAQRTPVPFINSLIASESQRA